MSTPRCAFWSSVRMCFFQRLHRSADSEWHWLDLALCLLFDTELWLLPQRGREERKERAIKAEGAQKVNKLELVYRAQHCSTWYKGQLSVPVLVSLHMADSIQDWDERLLEPGDGRLVWQGCLPYWWTVACSCKSSCEHSARVRCADVMRLISPYGPRHINSMIMHICLRSCETNVCAWEMNLSLWPCAQTPPSSPWHGVPVAEDLHQSSYPPRHLPLLFLSFPPFHAPPSSQRDTENKQGCQVLAYSERQYLLFLNFIYAFFCL